MATRRKRNLLDAALAESHSAICVLDGERRLRFFSAGMHLQTGFDAEDVEGLVCSSPVPANATPIDLLTSALSPSIEVADGQLQSINTVLPRKNGSSVNVRLTFVPVLDGEGGVARIVVTSETSAVGKGLGASMSQKLHAEITALRIEFRRRFSDHSFLGRCSQIKVALQQAELLKNAACGFSIVGPSGSGRRHLAKLIHVAGNENESSLVPLDCRLLTTEQVRDSLRVIRRLAASQKKASHQVAGTLVLVEGDRCPREVQQWILENLTEEALGIRLVSISETSLAKSVEEGWVMPDFNRLFCSVEIQLPPLHERGDDIKLLVQHFIQDCQRNLETSAEAISSEALDALQFYRWPGNVRELQGVIAEACQNSFDRELSEQDLPFSFNVGMDAQQLPGLPEATEQSLDGILQRFEIDVIQKTLSTCRNNKAEAARRLGMTRPKLYRRMKTLGIADEE
ncbi:MAG: helix-turn-helix domain-containing protein [Fuerstiella sp.]